MYRILNLSILSVNLVTNLNLNIFFCAVFMFRAMPMVAESRNGRTKRGFMFGGYRKPKKQMVEVQRIYKGEKMMMPMMQLEQADTFSAATKIEANIELGRSFIF